MPRRENETAPEYRARLRRQARERSLARNGYPYTPPPAPAAPAAGEAREASSVASASTPANARYDAPASENAERLRHSGFEAKVTSVNHASVCRCGHSAGWHTLHYGSCGMPGCACNQGEYSPLPAHQNGGDRSA